MVILALAPVLRMQTSQLLNTVQNFLNWIRGGLGRESAALSSQIVHDGDTLLVTQTAPPALWENHVFDIWRNFSKELGLSLREANCPWLRFNHLRVEDAFDADVVWLRTTAFIFICNGIE